MPQVTGVAPTSDAYTNGLLSGAKWASPNLTYSFPTSASMYERDYFGGEPFRGFEAFNAAQRSAVTDVLDCFSAVSNLSFTLAGSGDLRFAESDVPATACAYGPSTFGEGGDVWMNNSKNWYDSPVLGNYAYTTVLHEIGHALGLKHAHEIENRFAAMPLGHDSMEYTVMSYRSYVGASTTAGYCNETWGYAQSLMMDDIAAVQTMYGADYATNATSTRYSWSPTTGEMFINGVGQGQPGGNQIFMTVWDGGGADTYDMSNYSSGVTINLAPGGWSRTSSEQLAKLDYDGSRLAAGNVANARLHNGDTRSLIEDAIGGAGNDRLIGNAAVNTLTGRDGSDTYFVQNSTDRVIEGSTGDVDTVVSSVSFALSASAQVERLQANSSASTARIDLSGNGFGNTITGNAGQNVLKGMAGYDTLIGGKGSDKLYAGSDDARDTFVFSARTDSGNSTSTCDYIYEFDRKNTSRETVSDRIDLSRLDADNELAGDQAFRFVSSFSTAASTKTEGQIRIDDLGSNVRICIDTDGDRDVDMMMMVMGVGALSASDFLL